MDDLPGMPRTNDVDAWANLVADEAARRGFTDVLLEGLALGEECGEAQRAMLKREECRRGTARRGTADEWTDQLQLELGQALGVILNIIRLEGWTASDVLERQYAEWAARPHVQRMGLDDVMPKERR